MLCGECSKVLKIQMEDIGEILLSLYIYFLFKKFYYTSHLRLNIKWDKSIKSCQTTQSDASVEESKSLHSQDISSSVDFVES